MINSGEEKKKADRPLRERLSDLRTATGCTIRSMDRRKLISFILFFIVLEIAVLSIETAKWITPQPPLTLVLVLSMIATSMFGWYGRILGWLRHTGILVTGGLITLWIATSVSGFGQGTVYFALFIVFLVWIIGYVSTWSYYKKRNAWVPVILGSVAVLVNLSNLPDNYYYYFALFFVAAIIFVVRNRLSRFGLQAGGGGKKQRRGMRYFTAGLIIISILGVSVAWITPEVGFPRLESWVATKTLWTKDLRNSSLNFFAYVMAKQPKTTSTGRRFLRFTEVWHQENDLHFIVSSERPYYWQVHVYDTYTPEGWVNSEVITQVLDEYETPEAAIEYEGRKEVTSRVKTGLKSDVMLTAGDFISADTSVLVHSSNGDVIAVTTPRLFKPQESYMVTSTISTATPEELAEAGDYYPEVVADSYLQLPDDFSGTVRMLSANITAGAATPYEKALAIDAYLATFPYDKEIKAPPAGTDGVEYFLTEQKSGFCTYFASAMVVMLRAADVPSRLVVGYLPGESGNRAGEYILRDRHYHAWPQVYFPGYGWINLEATPGSASSPVTVETPVESRPAIQQGEQVTPSQWWDLSYWYSEPAVPPVDSHSPTVIPGQPWPFADIMGKMLSVLILVVIILGFIVAILYAFRSGFYRWLWKVKRDDEPGTVYSRLCALGTLVKLGPKPSQTPLEYAAVLSGEFPAHADTLNEITKKYMDNRFGGEDGTLSLMEEADLLRMRREIYNAMLKRLGFFSKVFRRPF